MTTLKNADKILKDYYLDVIKEQFNTGISPFFSMIEKTSENVYGKNVKKTVKTSYNNFIYGIGEDDEIPSPGTNEYAQMDIALKNFYGKIEISDKALRASSDSSGSIINVLNAEMENLLASSKEEFGKMLFGGSSTRLATITKSPATGGIIYVDDVSRLREGMKVDVLTYNGDSPNTSALGIYVSNINKASNCFTAVCNENQSLDVLVGEAIFPVNNTTVLLTGLYDIFNRDFLYNLYKSRNAWLIPHTKTLETAITINDIQETLDVIEERSGEVPNLLVCSWKTRRILQALFSENHVLTDTMTLDGGYKAISYNGIPIVVDKYCPDGEMYFLNTNNFKLYQLCDWEWLADDNGAILKQIPNKAGYSATLVKYAELVCEKPCSIGRIIGIE